MEGEWAKNEVHLHDGSLLVVLTRQFRSILLSYFCNNYLAEGFYCFKIATGFSKTPP